MRIRLQAVVKNIRFYADRFAGVCIDRVTLNLCHTNLPKADDRIRDEFFATLFRKITLTFDCSSTCDQVDLKRILNGPSDPTDYLPVCLAGLNNSKWSLEGQFNGNFEQNVRIVS